jgi:tetratricopeptide (TPR) repeat protein
MPITSSKNPYTIFLCVITLLMNVHYGYGQISEELQNIQITKEESYREIYGYITSANVPLANVNISVKDTDRGVKTDNKGFYTLEAKEGEVLLFTHIGMQSLEVIIEDITSVLHIKMRMKQDALDEVIIKTDRKHKAGFTEMDKPRNITTSRGNIDTRKAGYSVSQVLGEDLNPAAITLGQALAGRFAGLNLRTDEFGREYAFLRPNGSISRSIPALWDVDGVIYETAPPLDLSNIEDVAIIRSMAGTVVYGSEGAGGVIVVHTKNATFDRNGATSRSKLYTNKNIYREDALIYGELVSSEPEYLLALDTIYNSEQAYKMYQKMIPLHGDLPNFYLDVSEYFEKRQLSRLRSSDILSEMGTTFSNDPEALKALAYAYQERGLYRKAVLIYKDIINLRPNYAQSFRDLGNAYVDLQEYKQAWRVYMNYLYRGYRLDDSGAIGEIIYREMEALYIYKKDIAKIREAFELKGGPDGHSNDVRMVFEWNTSEAEFELEFVNPEKQAYAMEHSFFADKDLIVNEKLKGYSSKEFIIEDVTKGDWLVNLSYFGNKTDKPTYLKMTVYYNWGRTNQSQDVTLFALTDTDLKFQLLKLNKSLLAYKYR